MFLSILTAVDPLLQKFLDWLNASTKTLDEKLNADPKKLQDFFNEAGRVAAEVGKIIGNIASGLGNIIKANTGPGTGGQIMLDYFKDITAAFKAFSGSEAGQNKLKDYFAGAAENTKAILSSVGGFVKEILKLGDDPNVKKFWEIVGTAAPAFGDILKKTNEAAPSMGRLFVTIVKIIDAFTQTSTVQVFFDTLNTVASVILAIFDNKVVKAIMDFTAPIHGLALALFSLGVLWSTFGAGILYIAGKPLSMAISAFGKLGDVIGFLKNPMAVIKPLLESAGMLFRGLATAAADVAGSFGLALTPFLAIVAAVAAVVAIFVLAYKNSKALRDAISGLVDAVGGALGDAFNKIKDAIGPLATNFSGLSDIFKKIGDFLAKYIVPIFKVVLVEAINILADAIVVVISIIKGVIGFVWDPLKTALELVWAGIQIVWDLIVAGVKLYISAVTSVISFVWDILKKGLDLAWSGIQLVWNAIVAGVKLYISTVTTVISTVWNFLKTGLDTAWNGAKAVFEIIITYITGLGARIAKGAGNIWGWLTDGLRGAVNLVIGLLNKLIGAMNKISFKIPDIIGVPGRGTTFGINIPPIQPLAEGGVISPSYGGTIARIGEAGRSERVEPLDPNGLSKRDKAMIQLLAGGAGGTTINVYPSPGMNESELASMVSRQIAFQMRKGGA